VRTESFKIRSGFCHIAVFGLALQCAILFACIETVDADSLTAAPSAVSKSEAGESSANPPQVLSPVVVTAETVPLTDSEKTIDKELIEKLPLRNDSINEALTILPGVQYSESANISTQGGEILPPGVSISGGKTFENNFTIDGISNNSMLDPHGETDPVTNNDVPGHAQELFLDASLVEGIKVYDSNVSARFSGFIGGVVDAETIRPNPWFGGKAFYRTTRDEWTSFHIDDEKEDDFYNSTDHLDQPKFRKHHFGFDLHLPFSPRLLTVAAYRQSYSRIPLKQEDTTKTQERRQENFLFKTVIKPTEKTDYEFLWIYAPYRGDYFKNGFRNSDITFYGGGYLISATCHTQLPLAALDLQAAYSRSENSRQAPTHMTQIEISDHVWDKEGFLGDIEKTQQSFQLKADLAFLPVATGPVNHRFNAGWDIRHIEVSADRQDTSYLYTYPLDEVPRRTVYEKGASNASLRLYGLYIEDILTLGRLEVRPGVRLDYDDYMKNFNLAPRLASALDIFGNRKTILIAGFNRYYATTLPTYKLREALPPTYQERWSETDGWTFYSSSTTDTRFSELKTPHADEYVLGLQQQMFGGKAEVKYIRRDGRDEFAKTFKKEEDGIFYNSLNNNGQSRYEGYRISWEGEWQNHSLGINATYEKTQVSHESYDDLLNDEDLEDQVWFDGHLVKITELPRSDFNRPWVINFVYVGKFPYGFTFSGVAKYRSGYRALKDSGEDMVLSDGESVPIYEKVKKGGSVIVSCQVNWEKQLWLNHSLVLSLEVQNLLNKKTPVAATDDYEIGRQFWAGMEYRF
jgi:hypothetical protein